MYIFEVSPQKKKKLNITYNLTNFLFSVVYLTSKKPRLRLFT